MTSLRRIVPKWRCLLLELKQTLKEQEERGLDVDEGDEDVTVYLDAIPTMRYHYSCGQNFIQCLTTYSDRGVVGFQWGHTMSTHRMEVWTENFKGDFSHTQSLPLDSGFRVEHLVSVPSHRVFVGACNDLSLRMFSDPNQGMSVQYQVICPGSVFCMHYCRETGQLLTGGMGIITFWGFWISTQIPLGLLRVMDWTSSSLRRDSTVSALLTESQTLYALCDRSIKSFDHAGSQEYREFRGRGQSTLRCVSPDWVQRYIYTGDITGFVQVWSRDTRCLLQEFRAHTRSVSTLLLRPNTHTLLTSSPDGWLKEWSSSGNLLLKLFLDEPGGVRNLWPLGEHDILCQALSSFSVWHLQNLYRLFNEPGCGMQVLRRVEGGRGRAQLLAVSQDSIVRLISPISGELLLISWPFLLLDKALTYAYNPGRKELFVASGLPEVLVMDLTLCPSPAKHLVCTSKNKDQDDSVMCVEAVLLGGTGLGTAEPPSCLVFSGHLNGMLQLLSPHRLLCPAIKAHAGAILQMSSLAGLRPQLCCYGSDKQLSIWEVGLRESLVEVTPWARVSSTSGVVFLRLFSGLVFAVTPNYSLLFFSLPEGRCLRMERNPPSTISCLDGCPSLGLVALAGPLGIVEVWETRGTQQVEMRLGTAISQVCFANARGDLLVCLGDCICIIFGQRYLPARLVRQVLLLAPVDDLLEDPTPFLPRSQSCYDLAAVPRLVLMHGEASPDLGQAPMEYYEVVADSELDDSELNNVELARPGTGRKASLQEVLAKDRMRKSQARVLTLLSANREKPRPWPFALPLVKTMEEEEVNLKDESMAEEPGDYDSSLPPMESLHFDILLQNWPIAPDGYLPNSIIRSWMPGQEQPKPQGPKDILALERTFPLEDEEPETEVTVIMATAKAARLRKPVPPTPSPDSSLEDVPQEDDSCDLLKSIAESPWLIARPDVDLAMVINALLRTMDGMDCVVYDKCMEALLRLFKAYPIPPEIVEKLSLTLFKHMQNGNPLWKRLQAMKNLANLELLQDKDLFKLAEVLLDEVVDLRNMARDILSRFFHIDNMTALFPRLQLDTG
ncbi:WD repeat-containing protein 87-like isoform X3 [Osmerus eperlanus]